MEGPTMTTISLTDAEREHIRGHLESDLDCYRDATGKDEQLIADRSRAILAKLA
jgi:hypothetical protein